MYYDNSYIYENSLNLFKMLFIPETREKGKYYLNLKVKELEYKLDLINEIFIKDFEENKNIEYIKENFDILYNETKLLFPDLLLHIKDFSYNDYDILYEKIEKNIFLMVKNYRKMILLNKNNE